MIDMTLDTRRAEVESRLQQLRSTLGAQVLDKTGAAPEARAEIEAAEFELETIAAAVGEATRRQRHLDQHTEANRLGALRTQLRNRELDRLAAVKDAETSARSLSGALQTILEIAREQLRVMQEIDGKIPIQLDPIEVETRLANYLAAELATIKGARRHRLGRIDLPQTFF